MPKYYAECGEVRIVSDKDSPREAAIDLVATSNPDHLSAIVTVSETGFDSEENNIWFDTAALVEEVAQTL